VLGHQRGERFGGQQRHVAVGDEHGTGDAAGQRGEPALHRVAGAQPLLLHGDGDRAGQLVAERGDGLLHLLAAVPEHHDEVLGIELGDRVHRVTEQAASPDRVEDLGYGRAHPGALARGEDERGAGPRRVGHPDQTPWFDGASAERGGREHRTASADGARKPCAHAPERPSPCLRSAVRRLRTGENICDLRPFAVLSEPVGSPCVSQ